MINDFDITTLDWEKILNAITDLVAVLDKDFRIIQVNRALAEFLKQSPAALVGQKCYEVMHGQNTPWDGCPHEQMMKQKLPATLEVNDPFIGIPLLITASPITNKEGEIIGSVHVAKDISSVKKMQYALTLRNQQLEALNMLTSRAIRSQSIKEVVQVALAEVMKACSPDLALYYTVAGDWLLLQGSAPIEEEHLNHKKKVGECLCGLAAAHGSPVFSENISCDVRCTLSECKEAGICSFAALPIIHDNTIIGVLGIASRTETKYSDSRDFLEILAATVGLVAHNALLIGEIRKEAEMLDLKVTARTRELEEKNKDLQSKMAVIERMNKIFINRELRMVELKKKIQELERKGEDMDNET
ncbi:MAG: GAF domain-containing protein [Proteobacteria bacterium]|nr:GAF domain-containing protein [Pseudomonadota bacterium]MDP2106480.1 GAF domain-containing protein [Desulfobulbaceae bacterium]